MKKNTIKIKGKNYKFKYTIRALFMFEQITGKPFKVENLLDNYIFFYSILLASNREKENIISWDEFLDTLDENPTLFADISKMIEDETKKDEIFDNGTNEKDPKKKK